MDDRDRMNGDRANRRPHWVPWAVTSLLLAVVAVIAYNVGVSREAVETGAGTGRHFYWGFPGFWGFIILFWIFGGMRRLWWGCGPWYYPPWRYGRYYHPYDDRDFEEWHRREHERMQAPRRDSTKADSDRGPIT
jgi:hypothetical protein